MIPVARNLQVLLLALLSAAGAWADGEVVVASEIADGWRVSLLASPWPLRAGPADFSVLVQDAVSGDPAPDAEISLEVRSLMPGPASAPPSRLPAIRGGRGNPLFHSARLALPRAGRWRVRVWVAEPALPELAAVDLEVAPAASLFARHGFALSLPVLGVGLFWLHQQLRRRMDAGDPSRNPRSAE